MADLLPSAFFLQRSRLAILAAVAALILSLCVLRLPLMADLAEDSLATHLASTQRLIAEAPEHRLTPVQVGGLWAQVASDYHDLAQFDRAEDAYSRALRLLEPLPEAKAAYVITLGNLGTLYTLTERYDAAINCHKRALAALDGSGDLLAIAREQAHLSEVYLAMGKGKEAVRYSSPAADAIVKLPLATNEDRGSILIDHAYALCLASHCSQGLDAARQAMGIVSAAFRADSLPFGQVNVALGYAESKTGNIGSAEDHLREGVHVLRSQLPPSHPLLLSALDIYSDVLAKNHHDAEAHHIAAEVSALSKDSPGCSACTVNVTGLRGR